MHDGLPPGEENLGQGLILRTIRDEQDIERFAAFHTALVSRNEGNSCARLLRYHPEITYGDFLVVEDKGRGEIVSTTCLIPWHCRYEDISLDVAMLEMVLTHPDFRHHGLVRTQIKRFHQMVSARGFDLSIIEGIPYYYRQFGYAYAGDHWMRDTLPAWCIPDQPAGQAPAYRLRPATLADLPVLVRLYNAGMSRLQIQTLRSPDYWRYLLERARYPVRLVEDQRDGSAVGYIFALKMGGRPGTLVAESSLASFEVGMAVLRQLKVETPGDIQLGWPETNILVQIGRSLGSVPLPTDQWLVRISDVVHFLSKIGPVLERRLAASDCAGLTRNLCLNFFRQALILRFEAGQLVGVDPAGFVDASMGADGGDMCIPPEAFVRLVLGYRSLDELRDAWPDIVVKAGSRHILQVLFPRMASYIWMPYLDYGPAFQEEDE